MAKRIDHNHPLYVHPSDTSGTVLIPVKLKGSKNYGIWRRSMTIALQAKRKLGFITGAYKKDSVRDEHHEHWETYNALEDLKERFDKVNRIRIYQLHKEINSINQGTSTVAKYFTRLKELWSEFDAVVPFPDCGCVRGKEYVEHLQQQRLLQFVGGLNDSYDQARRQILVKTSEPSLNQAYSLIIEDECQKGSILNTVPHSNARGNDITTLWSAQGPPQNHKKPHNEYWNEKCDFCKIKGHMKENCYRHIGYPPNYKGRKKEGIAANSSSLGDDPSHSKDNYDQYSGVPHQKTWSPYSSNGIRMH
ncbi:hypothetical protein KY290_012179 [Solanum tuberosum]|uniref:Retrotransposon Copia-like N-terminal domain-containing protein n=1 Tax=Solanum tuberosum TaxID=4113 RepID=A0ABQ7W2R7_SOLTU|nr:hypothetical protein KY284_010359 [Solanum tuberosum]KAH0775042.1 hypothetical protein KY290_012179 [Solanum tuberosum]